MNRLQEVEDWQGRITRYDYDLAGHLEQITRPNGTVREMDYNNLHQITKIREVNADGKRLMHWDYLAYDPLGHITSIAQRPVPEPEPNHPPASFANASFDDNNRILSINGQSVSYDLDGNMLSGPLSEQSVTINFDYDSRNRLSTVNYVDNALHTTTYTYDAENHRTGMTHDGETTEYIVNPHAELSQILVKTAPDGSQTWYVYGLGLLYSVDEMENTTNYHFDHLGNTIVLSDDDGNLTDTYEYSPYGTLMHHTGSSDTEFLYNAQYGVLSDPNGLIHMRARYYNPYLRRFQNADPIGFDGGLNWFAYAGGNPLSFGDPTGTNPLLLIPLIIYGTTQVANAPGPNDPTFAEPPNVEEAVLLSGAGPAATLGRTAVSGAAAGGRSFMNTLNSQTTSTLGSQGARIGGLGTMTAEQGFMATGILARTTATSASNATLSASRNAGAFALKNYTRFSEASFGAGLIYGAATPLEPSDADLSTNPLMLPFQVGNLLGGITTSSLPSFQASSNASSGLK